MENRAICYTLTMEKNTPYDKWHSALVNFIQSQKRGIQKRIAQETKITPKHMNDIYKGRKRASQDLQLVIANAIGQTYEEMLTGGAGLIGKEKEPFPRYNEIMRLPIIERAWAILRQAAEAHDLKGYLSAFGDERSGKKPVFMKKFLDGDQTEIELYEESLKTFEGVAQNIMTAMKEQGFDE